MSENQTKKPTPGDEPKKLVIEGSQTEERALTENSTVKETAVKETAVKETAVKETEVKEAAVKEAALKKPAVKKAARKKAARKKPSRAKAPKLPPDPPLMVGPSPHVVAEGWTTQRMMRDVLIALIPATLVAVWVFQWQALFQIVLCIGGALATEAALSKLRGQSAPLWDLSATVTGLILALTLPSGLPWYISIIAAFMAIGLGKLAFGGLGFNIFNPAMVGRAFVMLSFAKEMGAGGYIKGDYPLGQPDVVSGATPLTVVKGMAKALAEGYPEKMQQLFEQATELEGLIGGYTNGSLGETSALACFIGGAYLIIRRSGSWEIPAGVIGGTVLLGGLFQLLGFTPFGVVEQVMGGALLFGAFFIATDPVTSPLTPRGKMIFGAGVGALVVLIRTFSGYPEGVMFAVLLMNSAVPLINRWTVPVPVGGPVPVRKSA